MNKENEGFNLSDPVCKAHPNKKVFFVILFRLNTK